MRVTADAGGSRKLKGAVRADRRGEEDAYSEPLFRANDMDNALTAIGHAEIGETKLLDVLFES
jgi:hypothetical protein